MKTFDDLTFNPHLHLHGLGGVQARMDFSNGYGVSVVRAFGTYGYEQGLYELAVFAGDDICYDTPVTNDVEGHLTPDAVTDLMQKVQELPARQSSDSAPDAANKAGNRK